MNRLNSEIYKVKAIHDFRELIDYSTNKYANNIAYKYKVDFGKPTQKVIEKKYSEIKEEIEGFGTSLLNMGLEGKKIAIISNYFPTYCSSSLVSK